MNKYKKFEPKVRVGERILYNTFEVRVIDFDGSQLGIMKTRDALERAKETGYDLVEVSPTAKPPVCKIIDYGKYKYEEEKKKKLAKSKQQVIKVKEIKLHPKTDEHDYKYRLENGKKFLSKGHKLKVTVTFKGRELTHIEYGSRWLVQMEEDLNGIATTESPITKEGRNMSVIFAPVKK